MRTTRRTLAILGLLMASAGPSFAQAPDAGGPSCIFPLACPGATPAKPEPLLGPPEEQADVPPAVAPVAKHKTRTHKKVAKKTT